MTIPSASKHRVFNGWLCETHIPRLVLWTTVLPVIFTAVIMGSLLWVREAQLHQAELAHLEQDYLIAQKERIKISVESEIARIDFFRRTALEFARKNFSSAYMPGGATQGGLENDDLEVRVRSEFVNRFNASTTPEDSFEYLMVYGVRDIEGGADFARMLINPNRPDLLGQPLSDEYLDAKGQPFRKEMLMGIREHGEVFVKYWYEKPESGEILPKITFFKYYPEWKWILAKGMYFDDLNRAVADREAEYLQRMRENTLQVSLWLLLFLIGVLLISILISNRIGRIFNSYQSRVEDHTQKLNLANRELSSFADELERRVLERTEELHQKMEEYRKVESEKHELLLQVQHQQKMDSVGMLASGVAHEINNPLHAIMGCAEMIANGLQQDEAVNRLASSIVVESKRVAEIVRNLLTFARQDVQEFETTDICPVVVETLSLLRVAMRHDDIEIVEEIPSRIPALRCRPNQIKQVIMNLLINARDAVNERYADHKSIKRIELKIYQEDQLGVPRICIAVSDNGHGISPDVMDRIFNPFFTTKEVGTGTGLGLSISYGIIKEHHGDLKVESVPDEFCRFIIDLPAAE